MNRQLEMFERTITVGGGLVTLVGRQGTTDWDITQSVIVEDEYRIKGRPLSGWALDVGAHIGAATVLLATLYPALRVLAIEPVPENVELLTRNVQQNGLTERVVILQAGAGRAGADALPICYGYRHYGYGVTDAYVAAQRFVGGIFGDRGEPEFTLQVPVASLAQLLATHAIPAVALLKIDCEGGEWEFLDTPSVGRIETSVGEYHARIPHQDARILLRRLLAPTHHVEFWSEEPLVGHFEARRR